MLFMLLVVGQAGPEIDTPTIQAVVALTVFASVILHGMTAAPLARRYGEFVPISKDRDLVTEMSVPEMRTKTGYGMSRIAIPRSPRPEDPNP